MTRLPTMWRARAVATEFGCEVEDLQSNHEGELIEAVHAARGRCGASLSTREPSLIRRGLFMMHLLRSTASSLKCTFRTQTLASRGVVQAWWLPLRRARFRASAALATNSQLGQWRQNCNDIANGRWRAERLLTALDERGLDQMIVSDRSNIRWLSGFTGSAGVLLISARGHVLITDGRYTNQAREQLDHAGASSIEVRTCRTLSEQRRVLAEIVSGRIVGAEATVMSHDGWAACSADNELLPVDGVVGQLRRAKDEAEIALIACAAEIATNALHSIGHLLIPGVSEREIRDELEYKMRKLGADGPSYETIVASGPTNAALPHARPTSRQLAVGDTVVIDVGALVDGYHSDMTRSFVIGDPTDEQQHWYQLVHESQLAGLAAVAAGVNVRDIDRGVSSGL